MSDECLFCRIVKKGVRSCILREDYDIVAYRDINTQAPMHVLVIPKRHITSMIDLSAEDDALVGKIVRTGVDIAGAEGHGGRGFRLVFNTGPDSGYAVFHVHLHVLGGRKFGWPPG